MEACIRSVNLLFLAGLVSLLPISNVKAQLPAQGVAEPDARALAVAKEVVDLAFPSETRAKLFEGTITAMVAQMRDARRTAAGSEPDPGLDAIVDRYVNTSITAVKEDLVTLSPDLFVAIANAYTRSFSLAELIEIRAFVATPTGTKYLQRSSEILSDPEVAAWNIAYFQRVKLTVAAMQKPLAAEVTAYLEKKRGK